MFFGLFKKEDVKTSSEDVKDITDELRDLAQDLSDRIPDLFKEEAEKNSRKKETFTDVVEKSCSFELQNPGMTKMRIEKKETITRRKDVDYVPEKILKL